MTVPSIQSPPADLRVIVYGATGMIGSGVLLACIDDPAVRQVLVLGRTPCGVSHPKIQERLVEDFFDYGAIESELSGYDACFFCLGVSAGGMSEEAYTKITYELTVRAAETLLKHNPAMTFCYVSGQGTDSSEKGRMMWARVKGRTENALLRMPFRRAIMFRPGMIQPAKGVRSKTALYRVMYTAMTPLFPLLKAVAPGMVTTSERLGRAMLRAARGGTELQVLESRDINALAAQ
jgi:uncharacterized protein YbjT (DUF2867 family)